MSIPKHINRILVFIGRADKKTYLKDAAYEVDSDNGGHFFKLPKFKEIFGTIRSLKSNPSANDVNKNLRRRGFYLRKSEKISDVTMMETYSRRGKRPNEK